MYARDFFLPLRWLIESLQSDQVTYYNQSSWDFTSGVKAGVRENTHACEPVASQRKILFLTPGTRKLEQKSKNPEQHWHAPPLCMKQPVRGALSANRLRLKCCKRQCWPFYMSELTHDAVRIRLLSYILVIALRCTYKPYFPTIKLIMHRTRHSYRKQNTRALIK